MIISSYALNMYRLFMSYIATMHPCNISWHAMRVHSVHRSFLVQLAWKQISWHSGIFENRTICFLLFVIPEESVTFLSICDSSVDIMAHAAFTSSDAGV